MKLSLLLLILSLSGNYPSEKEIPYRQLTWADFRAPVPYDELTVAARTTTQMQLETTEIDGKARFVVRALFLPDFSFVREKTDANLRHEQTHFKIVCIEATKCMSALEPLQGGDSIDKSMALALYNHYFEESDRRNTEFDVQTEHCLIPAAEKRWEEQISLEMRIFGNSSKPVHGRNR